MSEKDLKNKACNNEKAKVKPACSQDGEKQLALDDARRIKVLSPGMLVFKRFVRNKLAITGIIILITMFVFSFICPLFMPYSESQVFKHDEAILKEYAGAMVNEELRYYTKSGREFSTAAQAQLVLAINSKQDTFTSGSNTYTYVMEGDNFYVISGTVKLADVETFGGKFTVKPVDGSGFTATDAFAKALKDTADAKKTTFEFEGITYVLGKNGKNFTIGTMDTVALASMLVYDPYTEEDAALVSDYDFRYVSESAIIKNQNSFTFNGEQYSIKTDGDITIGKTVNDGEVMVVSVSDILVSPIQNGVFLSVGFKSVVRDAVAQKLNKFTFTDEAGVTSDYTIDLVHKTYNIKTLTVSRLITMYEAPSSTHLMGTDANGMDVLVRLMYGGRVSLMVGFVVVFLELFIGVIVGGISGYFGGWVDMVLMRFVDLFNSIPFYPVVFILGAAMDSMDVEATGRIFLLMAVLGIMGWTGIARVVRGQILSLREQDFMVATEATGIRNSRRIFRHLVPNVMPLLIVQATMSLGGIIITEATLSFLGLGVKYPLASWGSIINAANSIHVLRNFGFIWIPAGMLIVLTVLGFNFVGDGLRDAFDPKMKR